MANRITCSGLTRNLVIRSAREEWSAKDIRDDLDHIHQLQIVDLFFRNGNVYISLNSIQHALTAKSCMNSRLKYRKTKIACWPDDCAQPLPLLFKQPRPPAPLPPPRGFENRFEVLYQETEETNSSEDLMDFSDY